MSKHTPGPWTLHPKFGEPVVGLDLKDGEPMLPIVMQTHGYDKAQARANARLIAAAPELLEVARLLSLATDEGDDASQGTHYVDKAGRIRCKGSFLETIEKARAAIAKAEGKQ